MVNKVIKMPKIGKKSLAFGGEYFGRKLPIVDLFHVKETSETLTRMEYNKL